MAINTVKDFHRDESLKMKHLHYSRLLVPSRYVKRRTWYQFLSSYDGKIGDAKMDSGHLEEGEDPEDDYDVSQSLLSEQIIWMMDELFCHEVSYALSILSRP